MSTIAILLCYFLALGIGIYGAFSGSRVAYVLCALIVVIGFTLTVNI